MKIGDIYPFLSYGEASSLTDHQFYVHLDVENEKINRKMLHYESRFELAYPKQVPSTVYCTCGSKMWSMLTVPFLKEAWPNGYTIDDVVHHWDKPCVDHNDDVPKVLDNLREISKLLGQDFVLATVSGAPEIVAKALVLVTEAMDRLDGNEKA